MRSLYTLWSLQNWPNPTKPDPVNLSTTLSHSHILNTLLPQTSEFICQVSSIWCLVLWLPNSLTPSLFLRHKLWQVCLNKCSYYYCLTQPNQTKLHHETLGSDLHWETHIPGRNNNSRGKSSTKLRKFEYLLTIKMLNIVHYISLMDLLVITSCKVSIWNTDPKALTVGSNVCYYTVLLCAEMSLGMWNQWFGLCAHLDSSFVSVEFLALPKYCHSSQVPHNHQSCCYSSCQAH